MPDETTDQVEDTPREEPLEPVVEPESPPEAEVPEAPAAEDKVTERLEELEKSYSHVRSYADRTSQENAKLRAKLELLESQAERGTQPREAARELAELEKQWREQIADDPSKSVDFVYGVATKLRDDVTGALERKIAALEAKLGDLDPDYRENKEQVDTLAETLGVSREQALKAIRVLKPKSEATSVRPSQPARPAAPGAPAAKAGVATGRTGTRRITVDPATAKVLELVYGDDKKAMAALAEAVAAETETR